MRVVLGAAFVAHGLPHVHPAMPWTATAAAAVEVGGGIAILVGFATQIAGFLIAAEMVVDIFFDLVPHGAAFVSNRTGASFELPLTDLVVAFALVLTGAGAASIDAMRSRGRARAKIGSRIGRRR